MKRSFADRVKFERKVLRLVNEACLEPTLNGLSRPAIETWQKRNSCATPEIAELLMLITRKVQMEVDTSKDVFANEAKPLKPVDAYLQKLVIALAKIKAPDREIEAEMPDKEVVTDG